MLDSHTMIAGLAPRDPDHAPPKHVLLPQPPVAAPPSEPGLPTQAESQVCIRVGRDLLCACEIQSLFFRCFVATC